MGITEPIENNVDEMDAESRVAYYEDSEFDQSDSCAFTKWLESIKLDAEETVAADDNGDRDNLMHNRPFAIHFLHLCKTMLLWSGIGCDLFKSSNKTASSANVESTFKNIKQTLRNEIPTSVDSFVKQRLDMIAGEVKKASQKYITFVGALPASSKSVSAIALEPPTNECIACKNNHAPSGAHKCITCGKNVHVLPECSVSIGDQEGHGQKRICKACSLSSKRKLSDDPVVKPSKKVVKSQDSIEMNYTEKWGKKKETHKKTKQSKYLKTDPLWKLKMSINTNDVPNIGILANGNILKTIYKIDGESVALENTCPFDAVLQVSFKISIKIIKMEICI